MFEDRTTEKLKEETLAEIDPAVGVSTMAGSYADATVGPLCRQVSRVYQSLPAVLSMLFVDESSGPFLDLVGRDYHNLQRRAGTKARCAVTLTGKAGTQVGAGTVFLTATGLAFRLRAAVSIGAGGSALSISAYLGNEERHGKDLPSRIHLNNRSAPRLAEGVRILEYLNVPMSYHLCKTPELNDRIVEALPAGSLVINATGLGKDRPGSPLTDHCKFPENGLVWELNYRGTLEFMHQAEAQRERRGLLIEDGWTYFIHGWTQVIAEVFHIDITGERLAACDRLAREMRK